MINQFILSMYSNSIKLRNNYKVYDFSWKKKFYPGFTQRQEYKNVSSLYFLPFLFKYRKHYPERNTYTYEFKL